MRTKAPADPVLLACTDATDAPGSCLRINTAKLLDHYEALQRWRSYVEAVCDLPSTVNTP